jgi:hypothetical protein
VNSIELKTGNPNWMRSAFVVWVVSAFALYLLQFAALMPSILNAVFG